MSIQGRVLNFSGIYIINTQKDLPKMDYAKSLWKKYTLTLSILLVFFTIISMYLCIWGTPIYRRTDLLFKKLTPLVWTGPVDFNELLKNIYTDKHFTLTTHL